MSLCFHFCVPSHCEQQRAARRQKPCEHRWIERGTPSQRERERDVFGEHLFIHTPPPPPPPTCSTDSPCSSLSLPHFSFFSPLYSFLLHLKKGHFWRHKERDSFTPPQAGGTGGCRRSGGGREGGREEAQHNVFYMKGRG